MDQVHHAGRQGLQRDYLELRRLLLRPLRLLLLHQVVSPSGRCRSLNRTAAS
jgi:hypothetical protein